MQTAPLVGTEQTCTWTKWISGARCIRQHLAVVAVMMTVKILWMFKFDVFKGVSTE